MLWSVESPLAGALAVRLPRATPRHCNGLVHAVLPASVWNMCKRTIGVPQELGRSCRLLGRSRMELPGDQLQAAAAHSSAPERKERVQPRYRQAKATKRGGRGGRKSQRFGSTVEAGELTPEDPVEGSEASASRLDRGNHAEHFEVPGHVPVTRSNSFGVPCGRRICWLRNRML